MAMPSLEKSLYLQILGNGLHPDIDIFWTGKKASIASLRTRKLDCVCEGPKVVSRRVTVSHILSVNSVLQRRVTIWDNLNANDYDQRRLFMGPFAGRSSNLSSRISGMLINPNCEFEVNFVPFHCLGQWFRSLRLNESEDAIGDDDDGEDSVLAAQVYQATKALDQALVDWLPELNKAKAAVDSLHVFKVPLVPVLNLETNRLPSRSTIRLKR